MKWNVKICVDYIEQMKSPIEETSGISQPKPFDSTLVTPEVQRIRAAVAAARQGIQPQGV